MRVRLNLNPKTRRGIAAIAAVALAFAGIGAVNSGSAFAATDGDGTMVITPGGVLAGSNTNQLSFLFTHDGSSQFATSSQTTVVVPTGWTAPSTSSSNNGFVSASGSCSSLDTTPSVSGSGPWTITIAHRCNPGQSFTMVYGANAGATHVTAPAALGTVQFTTESRDGSNNSDPIGVQPTVVVHGALTKLLYTTQPVGGTAGAAFGTQPVVKVTDAGNNVGAELNSGTVAMSIASGPQGSFTSGTTPITLVKGVATFTNLLVNTAGTYTLTATPGSISGVTTPVNSSSLTVTPAAANKLVFGQGPTTVNAGATMSPAVTVRVLDAFNNLTTDAGRTITLAPSVGTIASGATANTTAGVATFGSIVINTANAGVTLNGTASPLTATGASSSFNVNAGPASKLVFVAQPSNVGAGATMSPAVTVQVQDASGNAVSTSGANVTLTPSVGTINGGATATTNAGGLATFSGIVINGLNSNITLSATSTTPSLATTANSSSFNVTAGAAAVLAFGTQPVNSVAGVNMTTFTVTSKDAFNNPVNGTLVTLSGSPSVVSQGTQATTNTSGIATFTVTRINTVATGEVLTATAGALSATSASFNVTPGPASKLAFVQQPSVVTAGVAMTPAVTVQIQDANGNNVASNGVAITLAGTNAAVTSGAGASTNAAGLATFSAIVINGAGTNGLTASSSGLAGATSTGFTVTAGPANKLGFVANPVNVVAGVNMANVTVQVQDQFGNAVTSGTNNIPVTLTSSGAAGIASGDNATTGPTGLATFSTIKINTAATGLTLSASSVSPAYVGGPSTSFNVTAAAASKLVWVQQPSNVTAGVNMAPSPTVQLQDQFSNNVSTSGTSVTLTPSTGSISNGPTVTTSGGLATFPALRINVANTGLSLNATSGSLTATGPSSLFNVTAAAANKLVFGQQPTNVQAGALMAPAVTIQVQDAFNNVVLTDNGRAVGLNVSSGSFNGGNSANTLNGVATFSGIQINTAATGLTITGTSSPLTATAASSSFNVTAAAANKLVFGQQPSNANVGVAMTPAVTVRVQDQFNNVVTTDAGRTITLAPSTGSIASGATANTAAGVATFSGLTINEAAASLTLTASASPLLSAGPSSVFTVSVLVANGATLTNNATDAGSGVDNVKYYYCAGVGGCPSGALIGSSSTGPAYSVSWTGQPANGLYSLVSVGVDHVTNTSAVSASIPVQVLNQIGQTITFTSSAPAAKTTGSSSYTVTATASSGLAVAFSLDASSTGCTIAGATVSFPTAGTCVINANQAGNALYTPAPQVQQTIQVLAPLAVTSVTSSGLGTIGAGASQTVTFNNPLNPATVPTSGTMTFSAGCILVCGNTTLNVPGFTNGARDTASQGWVAHSTLFGTNTIAYAVTFTLSGDHKSITMTVGGCSASCGNTAAGTAANYSFQPVASIADIAGDGSAAAITVNSFLVF